MEDLIRMSDGELVDMQDKLNASPIGTLSPAVANLIAQIDAELDRRVPGADANTAEEIVTAASQLPGMIQEGVEASSNLAVNAGIGGLIGYFGAKVLKGSGGMGALAGIIAGAVLKPFGGSEV